MNHGIIQVLKFCDEFLKASARNFTNRTCHRRHLLVISVRARPREPRFPIVPHLTNQFSDFGTLPMLRKVHPQFPGLIVIVSLAVWRNMEPKTWTRRIPLYAMVVGTRGEFEVSSLFYNREERLVWISQDSIKLKRQNTQKKLAWKTIPMEMDRSWGSVMGYSLHKY